jgi:hypothetical protein
MRNTGYVAAIGLRVGSGNSHHPLALTAERHLLMTAHSLRTSPSQTVAKQ